MAWGFCLLTAVVIAAARHTGPEGGAMYCWIEVSQSVRPACPTLDRVPHPLAACIAAPAVGDVMQGLGDVFADAAQDGAPCAVCAGAVSRGP